jgi:hypothetical protein
VDQLIRLIVTLLRKHIQGALLYYGTLLQHQKKLEPALLLYHCHLTSTQPFKNSFYFSFVTYLSILDSKQRAIAVTGSPLAILPAAVSRSHWHAQYSLLAQYCNPMEVFFQSRFTGILAIPASNEV